MRIAKPLLLVTTPIGVIGGVYEGYRLAGGLVFLMIAMLLLISAAIGGIVMTVRREAAEEKARAAAASASRDPMVAAEAVAVTRDASPVPPTRAEPPPAGR